MVLFLLSPVVGELLSGSSPPAEFFTPFGFTVMVLLYGGGALTARELKVHWRKGMGSLLLLGAAYGVLEEGLMVVSFLNPHWPDLMVFGVFGRWQGINWVWAVMLTAYHAIVSITVPVMLVELAFPEKQDKPWLSGRWRKIVPTLLAADVVCVLLFSSKVTGFWPPLPQYLLMIVIMALFVLFAFRLPSKWARRGTKPMRRPLFYGLITMFGAFTCGLIFWALPNTPALQLSPILVILLGTITFLSIIKLLILYDWKEATPMHKFSLATGTLTLFIVFAFLQD